MTISYITKDQSLITELQHPDHSQCRNQSLARATVGPGQSTILHKHGVSEEIYLVESGHGVIRLGDEQVTLNTGDSICIPPGTPHKIVNIGEQPLLVLCACSPAYSHDDTELLE